MERIFHPDNAVENTLPDLFRLETGRVPPEFHPDAQDFEKYVELLMVNYHEDLRESRAVHKWAREYHGYFVLLTDVDSDSRQPMLQGQHVST